MFDIAAVVNLHREGTLQTATLKSVQQNLLTLHQHGLNAQVLLILDDSDDETREVARRADLPNAKLLDVAVRDLGLARNAAVAEADSRYLGFIDADDLWGAEWLLSAFKYCEQQPTAVVAHPELNFFFGRTEPDEVFVHLSSSSPAFVSDILRATNPWTALSFAQRQIYQSTPYLPNNVAKGWGYEDWNWNCRTLDAGFAHVAVPETIHFVRRRRSSLRVQTNAATSWVSPTPVLSYAWHQRQSLGTT